MKIKQLFFLSALSALYFTACNNDEEKGGPVVSPEAPVFILNEGQYQQNDASITVYDSTKETDLIDDIYSAQNGKQLGELGQHILAYDSELFVTVSGSKVICRLGNDGTEKQRVSMIQHGDPRYLAAKDGKLYVTVYGMPGHVFRLNAQTLTVEDSVAVGHNPEQIVLSGSKLYVANAANGTGNTVSVIDIPSFTVTATVTVKENPNELLAHGSAVYVISWGKNWDMFDLQRIHTATLSVDSITKASKMAVYQDKLYIAYSTTTWPGGTTETAFSTYDPATNQLHKQSFLASAATETLSDKTVYLFDIHPTSGQIYIGTTDYQTNGSLYVFKDGLQIDHFTSGGVNPNKAVFINR